MGSPRAALARRTSQAKREDVKDPDQVFADVSKRQFDGMSVTLNLLK